MDGYNLGLIFGVVTDLDRFSTESNILFFLFFYQFSLILLCSIIYGSALKLTILQPYLMVNIQLRPLGGL